MTRRNSGDPEPSRGFLQSRPSFRFDGLAGLVGRVILVGLAVSIGALLFSGRFW